MFFTLKFPHLAGFFQKLAGGLGVDVWVRSHVLGLFVGREAPVKAKVAQLILAQLLFCTVWAPFATVDVLQSLLECMVALFAAEFVFPVAVALKKLAGGGAVDFEVIGQELGFFGGSETPCHAQLTVRVVA